MIQRDTLLIGDQFVVSKTVKIPKAGSFVVELPDSLPKGVEVVGAPFADTVSNSKDVAEVNLGYRITSFEKGTYYLPETPIIINHGDGTTDTLFVGGENVNYNTIQIDTTSFKPFDVKGAVTYPITFAEVMMWVAIVVAAVAAVWGVVLLVKKIRRREPVFVKHHVVEAPHIVAVREIKGLESRMLWQNNQEKQFYILLVDILREYIERRFGVTTMERTSAEILSGLKEEGVDDRLIERLSSLFVVADLVKFAKYRAEKEENEKAVPEALHFVDETKVVESETSK